MAWKVDARVAVRFGEAGEAAAGDALLLETGVAPGCAGERFAAVVAAHGQGCACCVARSPAALALDRLFQRRARGDIAFFRRVLVVATSAEAKLQVRGALQHDPLASARFRIES